MIVLAIVSLIIEAKTKRNNGTVKKGSIILIILAIAIITELIFEVISLILFIHYSNFKQIK